MHTSALIKNKVRTGVELSKFIESNCLPADIKECSGKWRYLENNERAASVSGLVAHDRIGMNIYDIGRINRMPDATIEKMVHADRSVSAEQGPVTLKYAFLDKPRGFVVIDKVVKQAVVDQQDKMIGILSYAQNIVPYVRQFDVYSIYKYYYTVEEAIKKFLSYMNVIAFFEKMPTDAELSFLLHDHYPIEKLSSTLKIPVDDIRSQQDSIKDKLIIMSYDELVQRLRVPEMMSFNL